MNRSTSLVPLALTAALVLIAGCQPPAGVATEPAVPVPLAKPAPATVTIVLPPTTSRTLQGLGFSETTVITEARLVASWYGGSSPVTATAAWSSTAPASLSVQVPAGQNRLFRLEGRDAAGHVIAVSRAMTSPSAGAQVTLTINAATDAAARVLEDLIAGPAQGEPADASGVTASLATNDITSSLSTYVGGILGYDATSNTYHGTSPRYFRAHALAASLRASGISILGQTVPTAMTSPAQGHETVTVTQGGQPVTTQDAQVTIYDPFSKPVTTDANGQAYVDSLPPGTWVIRAKRGSSVAWGTMTALDFDASGAATIALP